MLTLEQCEFVVRVLVRDGILPTDEIERAQERIKAIHGRLWDGGSGELNFIDASRRARAEWLLEWLGKGETSCA